MKPDESDAPERDEDHGEASTPGALPKAGSRGYQSGSEEHSAFAKDPTAESGENDKEGSTLFALR